MRGGLSDNPYTKVEGFLIFLKREYNTSTFLFSSYPMEEKRKKKKD